MGTAQHFDVAIIGTQTAGLIAAGLLAKRDRRVIVLDHGENVRFYRHHGIHMPLVPTLVPSFEDSPAIKRVHDELGIGPELRNHVEMHEPAFQAVMPQHRIDVMSKRSAFLEELALEFPELLEPVKQFFDRLFELDRQISEALPNLDPFPPASWFERLSLKRKLKEFAHLDRAFEDGEMLRGIPEDHPVRDLLLGPLTFFGHLEPDAPSSLHAVRLMARYFRGSLTFTDRLGGLHKMLQDAITEAGVSFQTGAMVQALETDGRRISRVVTDGGRSITADFVIYNALGPLEELIPSRRVSARVSEELRAVRPVGSLLVCNLLVRKEVIPCGMAEALFLLNGRQSRRSEDPRDPPIFLRRYPAQRGEANKKRGHGPDIDPEHEIISVATPVRTKEVSRSPERLNALLTQVMARVNRLVPFLDRHLVEVSLPSDTQHWDLEGDDVVRAIDPWALHPLYETDERPWLGVAARPNRGYVKNLIYAGRDVLPGLGLEGEYMTALRAVDTITKLQKKRSPVQ